MASMNLQWLAVVNWPWSSGQLAMVNMVSEYGCLRIGKKQVLINGSEAGGHKGNNQT